MFYLITCFFCVSISEGAFEPMPESPWLLCGPASSLFPRSPHVMLENPAATSFLESSGIAISGARPYGLSELDKTSLSGGMMFDSWFVGGAFSLSGDHSYTEGTILASAARKITDGIAVGIGCSYRRLAISGYGSGSGAGLDVGFSCIPIQGIHFAGAVRGVLRTEIGVSGDPAQPRGFDLAAGIVPVDGVTLSAGFRRNEGLESEYSFHVSASPVEELTLQTGAVTNPVRLSFAVVISLSDFDLSWGYGNHASLPGTHVASLAWGGCASDPAPLILEDEQEEELTVSFPLNINTATAEELEFIPGIGPSKAGTIHAWVQENGPVGSVATLDDCPGIGPAMLEILQEYLVTE